MHHKGFYSGPLEGQQSYTVIDDELLSSDEEDYQNMLKRQAVISAKKHKKLGIQASNDG